MHSLTRILHPVHVGELELDVNLLAIELTWIQTSTGNELAF